jgi:sentrin-specific protease 7
LQSKLTAKDKERFYFFNSFFFSKLADDDMMHGKAAFARVKKWTRKVKLFDKDYLFIPVNQSLHWSLIIICHPGNIGGLSSEDQ